MVTAASARGEIVETLLSADSKSVARTGADLTVADIDLTVLENRITLKVPLGDGLHEPVMLDTLPLTIGITTAEAAGAIAARAIASIHARRAATRESLGRLECVAEAMAREARWRGVAIEVAEVSMHAVGCLRAALGPATYLKLHVLGDDLRPTVAYFDVDDEVGVRKVFDEIRDAQAIRGRRLTEAQRHGAIGRIDQVAFAAISSRNWAPRGWLAGRPYRATGLTPPARAT